jgi:hypothetical protein
MFTSRQNFPGNGGKHARVGCSGASLIELLVASGVGAVVLGAIMSVTLYSGRSVAALVNYVDLDNTSRAALDEMTQEIRQADHLVSGELHSMRLHFSDPTNAAAQWEVDFVYNPDARTLARLQSGTRRLLLEECDFLEFSFFKRNPITNSYSLYVTATPPVVNPSECKAIQMRWICSRTIMQRAVNTESVQSARVVMRNK